jgi:hypothetical protein
MRRTLTRIVLAAVPTVLGCTASTDTTSGQSFNLFQSNGDCTSHLTFRVDVDDIEHAAPPAQLRIESCRMDVDACNDLCSFQLQNIAQQGGVGSFLQPGNALVHGGAPLPTDNQEPTPFNPADTAFTPTKCTVKFDGNSASSEIRVDSPAFNSNCHFEGTPVEGAGAGGGR